MGERISAFLRSAHNRADKVAESRARTALHDLRNAGMQRVAHAHLLGRIWELRDRVSAYDAAYVALAESLDATSTGPTRKCSSWTSGRTKRPSSRSSNPVRR